MVGLHSGCDVEHRGLSLKSKMSYRLILSAAVFQAVRRAGPEPHGEGISCF